MKLESLINALEKEFRASNNVFYEKIWEERVENWLKKDSKYDKLIKWIDEEIDLWGQTVNVFSPIERTEKTTKGMVETYKDFMQRLAILIHCRELLLESKLTEEERANIEYTLCKLFNIHYNEKLKAYISRSKQ